VTVPNGCDLRVETRNVLISSVPNPLLVTRGVSVPGPNDPAETNATLWLAPGERAEITLRIYDNDVSNNITFTNPDGTTSSIDPALNPNTVVTPGVSGQGVDVLDPSGATEPPIVTPTGSNLFYLQQPTVAGPSAPIVPAVTVRAFDNRGATLSGVVVTLALVEAGGATLTGNVATSDASGIATFPSLAVNTPGTYQLMASAASPGVVATAVSAPFTIQAVGSVPATVMLSNLAAIYDGSGKAVTVTTSPPGLAVAVTYSGSPTPPSAIGAYAIQATITQPGYTGVASATQTVASTLSGGGPGGAPYGPLTCAPGVFANGFRVDTNENYALTSANLLCASGSHPPQFGGGTSPDFDVACPAGEVMVGFFGTTSTPFAGGVPVVSSVGARCRLPNSEAITPVAPRPGGGTPFGPFDCPAGHAAIGVVGGQGAVVDSIALVCAAQGQ
jgi:hypothetical protein